MESEGVEGLPRASVIREVVPRADCGVSRRAAKDWERSEDADLCAFRIDTAPSSCWMPNLFPSLGEALSGDTEGFEFASELLTTPGVSSPGIKGTVIARKVSTSRDLMTFSSPYCELSDAIVEVVVPRADCDEPVMWETGPPNAAFFIEAVEPLLVLFPPFPWTDTDAGAYEL